MIVGADDGAALKAGSVDPCGDRPIVVVHACKANDDDAVATITSFGCNAARGSTTSTTATTESVCTRTRLCCGCRCTVASAILARTYGDARVVTTTTATAAIGDAGSGNGRCSA